MTALTVTPASAATVRWVNASETTPVPPGTSCSNAGYTTIAAAVAAAAPGDVIQVCPGTYAESVTVDKSLILRGSNTTESRCFDAAPLTLNPAVDTIVNPPGALAGTGFNITATAENVSVRGFVFTDADIGIQTDPTTSGHVFTGNTFLLNDFGMVLNTDGVRDTSVTSNCFRQSAVGGAGDGIFSNLGIRNTLIRSNDFFRTVHVAPAGETADISMIANVVDVRISSNTSRESETFAALTGSTDSIINSNKFNGDGLASAIFIGAGTTGLRISSNQITNALRGIRFCAAAPDCVAGAAATGVDVASNRITGVGQDGIVANPAALTNSVIRSNRVTGSGRDGIRVENGAVGNTGNVFRSNTSTNSVMLNCRDLTTGAGTASTANTWVSNADAPSSPVGICT